MSKFQIPQVKATQTTLLDIIKQHILTKNKTLPFGNCTGIIHEDLAQSETAYYC